jgi:hypothetical protein
VSFLADNQIAGESRGFLHYPDRGFAVRLNANLRVNKLFFYQSLHHGSNPSANIRGDYSVYSMKRVFQ